MRTPICADCEYVIRVSESGKARIELYWPYWKCRAKAAVETNHVINELVVVTPMKDLPLCKDLNYHGNCKDFEEELVV